MSGYAYLVIRCDAPGCYAETHTPGHADTYSEVRQFRRPDGWRTRRSGGRLFDLCPDRTTAKAGDDAAAVQWVPLATPGDLAFDHNEIVADARQ